MRASFLLILMVGCTQTIPPKPAVEVIYIPLPPPRVKGEVIDREFEELNPPKPPIHTWITGDELEKLIYKRTHKCLEGDPICDEETGVIYTPPPERTNP